MKDEGREAPNGLRYELQFIVHGLSLKTAVSKVDLNAKN
jgi:hypothetical protein